MIIFLHGQNSYGISAKLKQILKEYEARLGSLFLKRFDFESGEFNSFKDFVAERSIFDTKKFAIIDNVFELKEKKDLKKIFEEILNDKETIVIAVSSTKAPASFSFLLEKPVLAQEFKEIKKGPELEVFVKREAEMRGLKLNNQEIKDIAEVYASDLWSITTELDTLALMSEKSLPRKISEDFFKLVNTVKSGHDIKSRLSALEIILSDRGDEPAKVFNMMCYGWNSPELVDRLADYDVMIKSGRLEYEEVLLDLALR